MLFDYRLLLNVLFVCPISILRVWDLAFGAIWVLFSSQNREKSECWEENNTVKKRDK